MTTTISITSLLTCVNATGSPPCLAKQQAGKTTGVAIIHSLCIDGCGRPGVRRFAGSNCASFKTMVNFAFKTHFMLQMKLQSWPFVKVRVGAWIVEHNNEEPKRSYSNQK